MVIVDLDKENGATNEEGKGPNTLESQTCCDENLFVNYTLTDILQQCFQLSRPSKTEKQKLTSAQLCEAYLWTLKDMLTEDKEIQLTMKSDIERQFT